MFETIVSGVITLALAIGLVTIYVRSRWTKESKGKILCFFGFHKWESDKHDAPCVRCGIARNWREEYMRLHQIAGF